MVLIKNVSDTKIKDIEDKIPDITNLANNITINAKINEIKNEIPRITNLATTAALNAKVYEVKNRIPNISNLATYTALNAGERECLTVVNKSLLQNLLSWH